MAFLTLAQLKTHLDIDDATYDAKLDDYLAFAETKVYEVLGMGDKQLITDLVEAVENLDGFEDLGVEVPNHFTTSAYADTFADALEWMRQQVFPLCDRDQLAALAWYDNMLVAAKSACLLFCQKAAMDAGIMGKHESFGVQSIAVTEGGKTLSTVFRGIETDFRNTLLPYRKWRV